MPTPKKKTKANAKTKAMANDLLTDRANMRRTIADLHRTNADLDHQVRDLLAAKPITQQERDEITRLRAEHKALNDSQNVIVVYMRKNFPELLAGGELSTIICNALANFKLLRDARKMNTQ